MLHKPNRLLQLILVAILLLSASGCQSLFAIDERPNFLIIVTDDQRYDTMAYMPNTQQAIFDQGVTFTNGFITTPLCCPSRSSILTGMYAHNHGVMDNDMKLKHTTFIETMHENGYYTGLVGKYLNSWNGEARPEYDYWVSYFRGETRYYRPDLNVNGEWIRHGEDEYVTYVLGAYAVEFLEQASRQIQIMWATAQGQLPIGVMNPAGGVAPIPPYGLAVRLLPEGKDKDVFLAAGAKGSGAVYTDSGEMIHILRKVIVRVGAKLDWLILKMH